MEELKEKIGQVDTSLTRYNQLQDLGEDLEKGQRELDRMASDLQQKAVQMEQI